MTDDAVMNSEAARDQRAARGTAWRIGRIHGLEPDRVARDSVDRRAGVAMVAVAAEMVGAQRIDIDIEQSHSGSTTNPFGSMYLAQIKVDSLPFACFPMAGHNLRCIGCRMADLQ